MNRFLADTLAALNTLVTIVVVAAGAKLGVQFVGGLGGLLVGGAIGLVVAALYCGIIAFLALIESHLRVLAEGGGLRRRPDHTDDRIEPRL